MEYNHLGSAGLKVSELSLGAWVTYGDQVGEDVAVKCMSAAYDAGVNYFDNAEAYGNGNAEVVVGNVIKKIGWRREDLVLSSKVFYAGSGPNEMGLSRKRIFEACRGSLKRLQTDYLDIYICHRSDPNTPIEETARAMDDLIHQGKILYWGTSMWSKESILKAHEVADRLGLVPPQMEQPVYNMLQREKVEKEYAPLYSTIGLGLTTFSPLASGLLSGKYSNGIPPGSRASLENMQWLMNSVITPENVDAVRRLEPIAGELGCTLAQLAIGWCRRNSNVSTVLTGATSPEQVRENMGALEVVPKFRADVLQRIDAALVGQSEIWQA